MLESGKIVEAIVTGVEAFGVFLRYEQLEIVVLIPELEWEPTVSDCRSFTQVGKYHEVYIVRKAKDGPHVGSIRRTKPEDDPLRTLQDSIGHLIDVRIEAVIPAQADSKTGGAFGYLARTSSGAKGIVFAECGGAVISIGDIVRVVIATCDVESRQLTFSIVPNMTLER